MVYQIYNFLDHFLDSIPYRVKHLDNGLKHLVKFLGHRIKRRFNLVNQIRERLDNRADNLFYFIDYLIEPCLYGVGHSGDRGFDLPHKVCDCCYYWI